MIYLEHYFWHHVYLQKFTPKRHAWPNLLRQNHPKDYLHLKHTACKLLVHIWNNKCISDLLYLTRGVDRKPYIHVLTRSPESCFPLPRCTNPYFFQKHSGVCQIAWTHKNRIDSDIFENNNLICVNMHPKWSFCHFTMLKISLISHMRSRTRITKLFFFIILIKNMPIVLLIKVYLKRLFQYLFWKKFVSTVTLVFQEPGGKTPGGTPLAHQKSLA